MIDDNALLDPVPTAGPTTSIVAAVAIDNVIYVFDQSGDIYRVQPKPFVIEHLWGGNWPVMRGTLVGSIPQGVSSPSRYGGNFGTPPDNPMPPAPPVPSSYQHPNSDESHDGP